MQQELSKYLADLLHQHDRLSVPSLGTFELSHAPALVDQIQGQVNAPAKHVTFNPNLVMDDGVLVEDIQQRLGWSLTETQAWLHSQVDEIKAGLDRREIVELPGVGRFFRNFENKLQFVAENTNFNLDSFGLQAVAGQLVARPVEEKIPAIQKKVPKRPPVKKPAEQSFDLLAWVRENYIWLLAGLLSIVLIAVLIFYPRTPADPTPQEGIADVPQERLNASPSKSTEEEESTTAPAPAEENSDLPAQNENTPAPAEPDTEAPTLAPQEHTAVIAVGLFGNPDNVSRLLEQLSKDGYAPISRPEGNNTRVGVSIRYTDESELQRVLREVKRQYASSAFVLSRDGQEVNER